MPLRRTPETFARLGSYLIMEMQRKPFGRSARIQEGAIRRVLNVGVPQPYEGVGNALRSTFRASSGTVPEDMLDLLAKLDQH